MQHRANLLVLSLLTGACGQPVANAAGDAAAGETKAAACLGCHQALAFAGKDQATVAARIQAIAAGKVAHPPVGKLSADDVANLAAFYARPAAR
ncbi:MAG: hypothetical protein OEW88_08240 [Gammaproteobacteria bacterium]|nr:hypothetical protein [Gammaproteobacteria bacterium]